MKNTYITASIPESVWDRVHAKLCDINERKLSDELFACQKTVRPLTIEDVKIGDRVEWISPRAKGIVIDVDYCSIKIEWGDGKTSIQPKGDGFVGWKVLEAVD
ncbi:MAG TPA: hypothetical protein VJQ59_16830 [Candidatus Sulfotelmatobacter sp.]|nr:hypothetical protein [Candidatus Sulfotelmatobacter sp.]